jgi:hypothetical protein
VWFGKRLRSLLSVEYDPAWHAQVEAKLRGEGLTNVVCWYVSLDHDPREGTRPHYDPIPAYVRVAEEFPNEALDLVVVDGHYRQACILAVLAKIKPGGWLLVDNTNRLPLAEWGVPAHWPVVHQSSNIMTQTTIWQKPIMPANS